MTHTLRTALTGLCLFVLAACAETSQTTPDIRNSFTANSVTVDVSGFRGVEGRALSKSPAQVQSDVSAALQNALSGPGDRSADFVFQLTQVRLTSPGAQAAFGGPSSISGVLTITDAETGAGIFGPAPVTGTSKKLRLPGTATVVTAPSAENDYQQTVEGFALSVRDRLNAAVSGT